MENSCGALQSIERQIESCRQLLAVFQEERGIYQQGRSLDAAELTSTLERKKRLIGLFENQRQLMKSLDAAEAEPTEELKAKRKGMIRTLASLLEQLLVIDQENERLMREAATTARRPQATSPFASRQRPALQMRLPLMPFGGQLVAVERPSQEPAALPEVKPAPQEKVQERPQSVAPAASAKPAIREFRPPTLNSTMPVRPKSHLRVYGASAYAAANANA